MGGGGIDPSIRQGDTTFSYRLQTTLDYFKIDRKISEIVTISDRGHCNFAKSTSDIGLF